MKQHILEENWFVEEGGSFAVECYGMWDRLEMHVEVNCDPDEKGDRSKLIAAAPALARTLQRLSDQCDRLRLSGQSMTSAEKDAHDLLAKLNGGAA